ncbi:DinB family protein [Promicromonospora iranensis]|uniref:Damage-inducible protein DinB n=1 Tax=Promicromonospora iranensis TaxID=1105144 RepID=A0ABU2CPD5_9MICO|nr:DinB family protein [Promicromonospora iranensis]MDR7383202.1 putative damage-inducible protein DinB [Promicromonospora iranensis]
MPLSDSEPRPGSTDPAALFTAYLDYYRQAVDRKLRSLSDADLRASRLPSGWSPLELLIHLVHMEQRWFRWGFLAEPVERPWDDHAGQDPHGPWAVPDGVGLDELLQALHAGGATTSEVLATHALDEQGALGGRFTEDPPTLAWICFHVLQEYARHAGHLDISVELAGGATGE